MEVIKYLFDSICLLILFLCTRNEKFIVIQFCEKRHCLLLAIVAFVVNNIEEDPWNNEARINVRIPLLVRAYPPVCIISLPLLGYVCVIY